jgi:spiro-SPASM protein
MRRIAVLNALDISAYASRDLPGGRSALKLAIDAARNLPGGPDIVFLGNEGSDAAAMNIAASEGVKVGSTKAECLSEFVGELGRLAEGYEDIILLPADSALPDALLAAEVMDLHGSTVSEFTFADGFPAGSAPELLRVSAIPALALSAAKADARGIPEDPLYAAILKDINAFDVETVIAPLDMRAFRLSFRAKSKRAYAFLARLFAEEGLPRGGLSLLDFLDRRRDLHRSLPAYYYVQITEACPQACSYCPYPRIHPGLLEARGRMEKSRFSSILDQAEALSGDAVIGLSPFGEPGLHEDISDLCAAVLERQGLSLLIETSGLGWSDGAVARISSLPGRERIDWVVSLDANGEEGYRKLRGEGYGKAIDFTDKLLGLFPARVFPQAVRMLDNEEDLEGFYRGWKEKAGRVLIQKYDTFAGFLPEKEVCDLSPLKRGECWHLKRDMVVLLDGAVPLCREDLGAKFKQGNAFGPGGLASAWERMDGEFRIQASGGLPSLCGPCDEHYTFNY